MSWSDERKAARQVELKQRLRSRSSTSYLLDFLNALAAAIISFTLLLLGFFELYQPGRRAWIGATLLATGLLATSLLVPFAALRFSDWQRRTRLDA